MSKCRICNTDLKHIVVDLGVSPLANSYVSKESLNQPEYFFPLKVYVCEKCFLVQLKEYKSPENIFSDYAYFSSYSNSWLQHAKSYSKMIKDKLKLSTNSTVIEIASNDGYLLQNFINDGINILGIEPAQNVADVAIEKGIPTRKDFFSEECAKNLVEEGMKANLIIANNVFAHVPNILDFSMGLKTLLHETGTVTIEFPHLLNLIEKNQFDTIYHEHFSYLSLNTVIYLFKNVGLTVYDVEKLNTHGGSLRLFVCHNEDCTKEISNNVSMVLSQEINQGILELETYELFSESVKKVKRDLLNLLISLKEQGKSIAAYGAPAKGNTLLNYCGIKTDFINFTVDISPYKQGYYLPGTRIRIEKPEQLSTYKPDYILILPWNIKEELINDLDKINDWGAKYIIPIPKVEVL